MRKSCIKRFCLIIPVVLLSFLIVSCSSTKKTKYFQDIPDSGKLKTIEKAVYVQPKIQVDDILTVIIQTVDPQASALLNTGNTSTGGTTANVNTPSTGSPVAAPAIGAPLGYLVDKEGFISIPVLGKIKVEGLSTSEASKAIFNVADSLYKNSSVIVRFANFKVNVGGEVSRPGVYIMPNEKVTVMDALSMAGDLTIFGERENVLLIRENEDGTKTPYRINLKKTDFMTSPYYYLKQNDYIYVEPSKGKAAATDAAQARIYTIIGSLLTVLVVLLTRVK